MCKKYILGIDTSNYRTSVAIVSEEGEIVSDERMLLKVKKGERGLRQSEALFQHVENLPLLFDKLPTDKINISAVAVSTRPRPVEGSYMPCFKAGYGFGKAVAKSMNVPFYEFSHQEGHIEAIRANTNVESEKPFLAWHLSGGTCELLKVNKLACDFTKTDEKTDIEIIGGSKDISFGQVIDRVGVQLGMNFPAGEEMDQIACKIATTTKKYPKKLTKIKTQDLEFNLSGIETQTSRLCETIEAEETDVLVLEVFDKILDTLVKVTEEATKQHGINDVIFAGGVSCSKYISERIINRFKNSQLNIQFGLQTLSGDNAVGIALLGGKAYGNETR